LIEINGSLFPFVTTVLRSPVLCVSLYNHALVNVVLGISNHCLCVELYSLANPTYPADFNTELTGVSLDTNSKMWS
jgi:hypothetical protein